MLTHITPMGYFDPTRAGRHINDMALYTKERRAGHPVFQDDEIGSGGSLHGYITMVMTENKAVDFVFFLEFSSEFIQRFIFATEDILLMTRKAIALGPSIAKTERNARMQHAEKKLQHAVMEHPAKETIAKRHRTKAVAMSKTEHTAINLNKGTLHLRMTI